jgi:peroxin-4
MSKLSASRRLLKELKNIQQEQNTNPQLLDIFLELAKRDSQSVEEEDFSDDLFHWHAWIQGPPETPYAGAYFLLDIVVPLQYPLIPPAVKFITRIFHPNVHFETGEICLDILKSKWSAV